MLSKSDHSLLIFCGPGEPPFPDIVLELVENGKAVIKKHSLPVKDCSSIISYEIGYYHATYPQMKFVLWGKGPLAGLYRSLLKYDPSLRDNLSIKDEKEKKRQGTRKEKVMEEVEASIERSNTCLNTGKITDKKRNRNSQCDKDKADESLKGQKQYSHSKQEINQEIIQNTDTVTETSEKCMVDTTKPKPEEIEETFEEFKKLLDDILEEDKTSQTQCNNILLSIMELSNIQDMEIAEKVYKDKLNLYCSTEHKANYYWERTKSRLKDLMRYLNL